MPSTNQRTAAISLIIDGALRTCQLSNIFPNTNFILFTLKFKTIIFTKISYNLNQEIHTKMLTKDVQLVFHTEDNLTTTNETSNQLTYTYTSQAILLQTVDGQIFIPANTKLIINDDGNIIFDENKLNCFLLTETNTSGKNRRNGEEIDFTFSGNAEDCNSQQIICFADETAKDDILVAEDDLWDKLGFKSNGVQDRVQETEENRSFLKEENLYDCEFEATERKDDFKNNEFEIEKQLLNEPLMLNSYLRKQQTMYESNLDLLDENTELVVDKRSFRKRKNSKKLIGRILEIKKSENTNIEINEPNILIKTHKISRLKFENISKILSGLMQMESVRKKLYGKLIIIKLIEKYEQIGSSMEQYKKNVSFLYGCMKSSITENIENWSFELFGDYNRNDTNSHTDLTSLSLTITTDISGRRTTRINLLCNDHRCDMCGQSSNHRRRLTCSAPSFTDSGKHETTCASVVNKKSQRALRRFVCVVCGREFKRQSNLQRHIEIHGGSGRVYRCKICSCSYNFVSSLTRHVVQNHM